MNDSSAAQLLERMHELAPEMREIRQDIHRHPELAYEEKRTAAVVAQRLRAWGVAVHEGIGGTGVVGVLEAGRSARTVGLRADMDALPIHERSGLAYESVHQGRAHSCGHDGHTAMLLCAARYLAETRRFDGRIHFIFQPAEEGKAGARAMIEDGLFEKFPCAEVYALHNWPALPAGTVATRPGAIMAAADRVEITVRARGGHAAQPHLSPDAILCAAQIVAAAHTLVGRRLDPNATAVLSLTRISGGASHNVMPAEVSITGTVRTFDGAVQDRLESALRDVVEGTARASGCTATLEYHRYYPATINDAGCAQHALEAARALLGTATLAEAPAFTSEDFAFMLNAVPGAYIWLGQGSAAKGAPLHTPGYDFNDEV
ncbi:MAG: amidohydrolase, partial [Usitatibacter sp.]